MRNWKREATTAQVISISRVSLSGSAPVRALRLVALVVLVVMMLPFGGHGAGCPARSPKGTPHTLAEPLAIQPPAATIT
nr:hypothetical protein KPHV_84680 [Kitasatospora purpeofusca]